MDGVETELPRHCTFGGAGSRSGATRRHAAKQLIVEAIGRIVTAVYLVMNVERRTTTGPVETQGGCASDQVGRSLV